ncbi:MAG: chemotaxis response regulator protein-glutamate methylesterase [bacterium]
MKPIRVLIVDDSALVRKILSRGLQEDPGIEVVGTAMDAYIARDKLVELAPQVLTLDVEMPGMDGVEFLRRVMPQWPIPIIMVSSLTQRGRQITLDALESGAVDFVAKPSVDVSSGLHGMMMELRTKVKIAATANVSHWKQKRVERPAPRAGPNRALEGSTDKVIAIGASTGGIEAIRKVLTGFPANTPGTVIVQHMPANFTSLFAERMNTICAMEVKEAQDGDRVMNGRALIAPGEKQMIVKRSGGMYRVKVFEGEKVSGHCPSVDVLMHSVAKDVGSNALGIMLTGMGGDGSDGMLAMRKAGAWNIAQDEATCIVFGMPKVAFEKGGAETLVPLEEIPGKVIQRLSRRGK